jgi:hypothetical protein
MVIKKTNFFTWWIKFNSDIIPHFIESFFFTEDLRFFHSILVVNKCLAVNTEMLLTNVTPDVSIFSHTLKSQ